MRRRIRPALAGLLSAAALTVAACGGAGAGSADQGNADKEGSEATQKTGMAGMDHSGMDHGSGDPAVGMLAENGRYSDERFIDEMVPHHRSAVEMAEVALKNAEHREVERLAENIVSSQEAEIEELKDIKREEFGTSRVPTGMGAGRMEDMGMMMNPGSLAKEDPFDRAFIDAMIPHHESAVEMAEVAREKSDNPRVRELAGEIVGAQEREISRMRTWRDAWYPES